MTVRIRSSVVVQPLVSMTVRRSVAFVAVPVTFTTAARLVQLAQEFPDSTLAGPEITLHVMLVMALTLGWAAPLRLNVVVVPVAQLVWSGPASASPSVRLTWMGVIRSTMLALGDCDSLVLIKTVLMPRSVQGSEMTAPISAVR